MLTWCITEVSNGGIIPTPRKRFTRVSYIDSFLEDPPKRTHWERTLGHNDPGLGPPVWIFWVLQNFKMTPNALDPRPSAFGPNFEILEDPPFHKEVYIRGFEEFRSCLNGEGILPFKHKRLFVHHFCFRLFFCIQFAATGVTILCVRKQFRTNTGGS